MAFVTIIEDDECFEHLIGDSVFGLRRLGIDKHSEFVKMHTKTAYRKHQAEEITNWSEVYKEMIAYIIVHWKKVLNGKGEEVTCNRDNKIRLPDVVREELFEACNAPSITKVIEKKSDKKN